MRGGDWYGSAVNVAARLAAAAEPNQALVSVATRAAADGREWPGRSRRELVLRGVETPDGGVAAGAREQRRWKDRRLLRVLTSRTGNRTSDDLGPW